jgi:hypothetical protein
MIAKSTMHVRRLRKHTLSPATRNAAFSLWTYRWFAERHLIVSAVGWAPALVGASIGGVPPLLRLTLRLTWMTGWIMWAVTVVPKSLALFPGHGDDCPTDHVDSWMMPPLKVLGWWSENPT